MNKQTINSFQFLMFTLAMASFAICSKSVAENKAKEVKAATRYGGEPSTGDPNFIGYQGPGICEANFKCHINIYLHKGEFLHFYPSSSGAGFRRDPVKGKPEIAFGLRCYQPPFNKIHLSGVVKKNGKWDLEENFPSNPRSKIINFNGKNWEGVGVTEDDDIGEETLRQRRLLFCLIGEKQILCGGMAVMPLMHPKESILNDVLSILKTIEFIDDPETNHGPDAGTSSPKN